jgi:hypothetical protein
VILAVGVGSALLIGAALTVAVWPALLVLAAVPGVLLVLRRPDIGALVLVAAVPITSGMARGLAFPGLRVSELLVAVLATIILVTARTHRSVPWGAFDWLALGYASTNLVLGLSQLLARGEAVTFDLVGTLLGPFQYLLLYRAVLVALPEPEQRRQAIRWLLLASIPVSLSAILQHFHVAGVRGLIPSVTGVNVDTDFGDPFSVAPESDGNRATGIFPHWQVLGAYQFWVLLIGTAALLGRQAIMSRTLLLVVLGLATAAIFTTVTMAVIISAAIGMALLAVWYGRIGWILPTVLIGGALVAFVFGPSFQDRITEQFADAGRSRPAWVPQTMDYRYRLWRDQYLPIISDGRWWTGYGPDPAPNLVFNYTESLYISLLMRGGLPLLLWYLGLMAALATAAYRRRGSPDIATRCAARTTLVAALLLLPMHFVEPYFIMTGMAPMLWITAALALGGRTAERREPLFAPIRRALPQAS